MVSFRQRRTSKHSRREWRQSGFAISYPHMSWGGWFLKLLYAFPPSQRQTKKKHVYNVGWCRPEKFKIWVKKWLLHSLKRGFFCSVLLVGKC